MDELTPLRAAILRFFMQDGVKQTHEFVAMYGTQNYDEKLIRNMIYAMALCGLLEKMGSTRGSLYLTTRLGFVVLASLGNERLSDDKP